MLQYTWPSFRWGKGMGSVFSWCEGRCWDDGERWECAQLAGWETPDGLRPWGDDTEAATLQYLAAATNDEWAQLADQAAWNIDRGVWQGVQTPNGGWIDGPPWDQREATWRVVAAAFLARYQAGDRTLDEGMIALAPWDFAIELAWRRGWCPEAPHTPCMV